MVWLWVEAVEALSGVLKDEEVFWSIVWEFIFGGESLIAVLMAEEVSLVVWLWVEAAEALIAVLMAEEVVLEGA